MASKHAKKGYVLVDEGAPGYQADVVVPKGAHARISVPEISLEPEPVPELEPLAEDDDFEVFAVEDLFDQDEPVQEMFPAYDDDSYEEPLPDEPEEKDYRPAKDYRPGSYKKDDPFENSPFFAMGDEENPEAKDHKGLKIAGIVVGVLLAILAVVYGVGAWFFGGHFYPNTTINGIDVSLKAPAEVQNQLASTLQNYELEITGPDYALTIAGKDISYGLDPSHDMLAAFNKWAWPVEIATNASAKAGFAVVYNQEVLDQILGESMQAHNETATAPVDAHLAYQKETNTILVAPEELGNLLDTHKTSQAVKVALGAAARKLELTKEQLVAPAVLSTSETLKKSAEQINKLSDVDVTLMLGEFPALKINKGNLLDWVLTDDNGNVALNEAVVHEWAQNTAAKMNTYGTVHSYIRPDGKECTVECSEAFGWKLDVDELTKTIENAVRTGAKGEIAIPCESEGAYYNMETGAEWARYVDVDLDEQHAYFYDADNELIWESDIVSGNVNYGDRHTPTGVYNITRKARNEMLYTYEAGKEEPNKTLVYYWMPFIGNVYAFHDAWWQPGFGGTRYRDGYGSHGCVNLPSDAAAELYDLIDVDDLVVIHW